ncbi:MAG: ribonuclease III [Candidatus Tokpelaia sp. JSC189]|nr:MAG: ribonuclease III [Candidatus Tokpelaia sp. JSC189]
MGTVMAESYIKQLEKAIGYHFKNKAQLEGALTHASFQGANQGNGNYERLEFLGDRVLGLLIAEILSQFFPNATVGELSIRLNGLVNAEVCAQVSEEIGLPDKILMGAEMKSLEGRRLINIYADVVEALIAVIYLDGGLEAVRPFIHRYWDRRAQGSEGQRRDAKTQLQEWAHQESGTQPFYRILKRKGPDHDPVFEVEVRVSGFAPAKGKGQSKRQAERAAAEKMLCQEGVWEKKDGEQK